ncbi:cytidylyltransferase domain-containing protein [Shewanella decolorationis]|uniref:cytidylyltransferase domain-containing protein n=1 Tax=Shewanella decolorationis TaxID=256839 RepID=UPI00105704AF|nr:glycosyltransferase family protein [Shewanella decolorationis]
MPKVICISQARMGSSRLPGKVLAMINGKPMLEYHVSRVHESTLIDHHIIATTDSERDHPIVDFCIENNHLFFCGNEDDVLSRFYLAALQLNAQPEDIIIRLTADCPLVSGQLIDETVLMHLKGASNQYTHVSLDYFPRGFDVEVFSMENLTKAYNFATKPAEREHVTLYLYSQPNMTIVPIESGDVKWSQYRLCVDEADDLELINQLINKLGKDWLHSSPEKICNLLASHPEIALLNSGVIQKTVH